jgi:hypothetical protein
MVLAPVRRIHCHQINRPPGKVINDGQHLDARAIGCESLMKSIDHISFGRLGNTSGSRSTATLHRFFRRATANPAAW